MLGGTDVATRSHSARPMQVSGSPPQDILRGQALQDRESSVQSKSVITVTQANSNTTGNSNVFSSSACLDTTHVRANVGSEAWAISSDWKRFATSASSDAITAAEIPLLNDLFCTVRPKATAICGCPASSAATAAGLVRACFHALERIKHQPLIKIWCARKHKQSVKRRRSRHNNKAFAPVRASASLVVDTILGSPIRKMLRS